jgi:AcrR family transcriptional regulator
MGNRQTNPRHRLAPRRAQGFPLGTIRYYFGGRERLLVYVARHEHLARLDRVRRALRNVSTNEELTTALLNLAQDLDHFQVSFGLLTEARQMPKLQSDAGGPMGGLDRQAHRHHRRGKSARSYAHRPRPLRIRAALELAHHRPRRPPPRQPTTRPATRARSRPAVRPLARVSTSRLLLAMNQQVRRGGLERRQDSLRDCHPWWAAAKMALWQT